MAADPAEPGHAEAASAPPPAPDAPADGTPPTPLAWRLAVALAVVVVGGLTFAFRDRLELATRSALGFCCLFGVAACCSSNLRLVSWRTILFGLGLQLALAVFILRVELTGLTWAGIPENFRPGYALFEAAGGAVNLLVQFSQVGAKVLFGPLADADKVGQVFGTAPLAFLAIVPTIIFISSLFSVLYYFGVLQMVVRVTGRVMMFLMRTSGAETLSAVANVFMGQTEAPLIIKPYIPTMTRSELMAMMVGGFATISGGMMVAYISLGADPVALLVTSVMAAPCGLYLTKLVLPETGTPLTSGKARIADGQTHANVVDAAAAGASDGMQLAINVVAMLIAFLALLALIDFLLGRLATGQSLATTLSQGDGWWVLWNVLMIGVGFWAACRLVNALLRHIGPRRPLHELCGTDTPGRRAGNVLVVLAALAVFVVVLDGLLTWLPERLTLSTILGTVFSPVSFLMGVADGDVRLVADLLGIKLAANEFLAFQELTQTYREALPPQSRSYELANFALTGFANFGSVGIQIGGIGALAPNRRPDLARLGIPAMLVGFLATVMNAALAGVFL